MVPAVFVLSDYSHPPPEHPTLALTPPRNDFYSRKNMVVGYIESCSPVKNINTGIATISKVSWNDSSNRLKIEPLKGSKVSLF